MLQRLTFGFCMQLGLEMSNMCSSKVQKLIIIRPLVLLPLPHRPPTTSPGFLPHVPGLGGRHLKTYAGGVMCTLETWSFGTSPESQCQNYSQGDTLTQCLSLDRHGAPVGGTGPRPEAVPEVAAVQPDQHAGLGQVRDPRGRPGGAGASPVCLGPSQRQQLPAAEVHTRFCRLHRYVFSLAVRQPALDMPEVCWKAFIDFEVSHQEHSRARCGGIW